MFYIFLSTFVSFFIYVVLFKVHIISYCSSIFRLSLCVPILVSFNLVYYVSFLSLVFLFSLLSPSLFTLTLNAISLPGYPLFVLL